MSENNTTSEKIPFAVEISRMIELLAAQIYPSPFALLRENLQNAFDAILLRKHLGHSFEPAIHVQVEPTQITISDNGIGMSKDDLRNHFWRAGSSSKNTPEAKAAGVVGTFGIGAMANFGIAEKLIVVSESALTAERTQCEAARSTLSVTEDCIDFHAQAATGVPGTVIVATMQGGKTIEVNQAKAYVKEFIAYVPLPVFFNGELVSQHQFSDAVPKLAEGWGYQVANAELGGGLVADVALVGATSGEVRIELSSIIYGGQPLNGQMILKQGTGSLRTFRSRFGLATASVASIYHFGGIADFTFLQPTAGREALTTDSMQLLQRITSLVDEFVSLKLAERPESNANLGFISWASQRQRYDLCSHLQVRVEPEQSLSLGEVRAKAVTVKPLLYTGSDSNIIKHASNDRPLIVVTRTSPRRDCELGFLRKFVAFEEITDEPKVLKAKASTEYSFAEAAMTFRIASILSSDYFLDTEVKLGKLSHSLPILVTRETTPVQIFIDPEGTTARIVLQLYDKEYGSFSHMVKDFVRNFVFPRIAHLVPSSTRQGAEAFLKNVQRNREVFEYEASDLDSLTVLWKDYLEGKLTLPEASKRSEMVSARSYQYIERSASATIRDVAPDVIDNEGVLSAGSDGPQLGPIPAIQRADISTELKLLTIPANEAALRGFRSFLAITDRVREERGDFFLQPHRTSVVWGGQKALFIFEHHSGEFGLYYDIQTPALVSVDSGGGSFETCTIVMKNRIFIPVPEAIQDSFLPKPDERKRLEIRCDILHIDQRTTKAK